MEFFKNNFKLRKNIRCFNEAPLKEGAKSNELF